MFIYKHAFMERKLSQNSTLFILQAIEFSVMIDFKRWRGDPYET